MRANIGVCLPTSISIFALVTSAALSRSVKVPNTPTYGNTCTFAALNHPAVPFYQWFHSHLAQIQLACRIRSSCANGTSTPHWWLCTMRRRWIDHDGLLPFVRNRSFSSGVFRGSSTAIRLLWGGRQSDGRRKGVLVDGLEVLVFIGLVGQMVDVRKECRNCAIVSNVTCHWS